MHGLTLDSVRFLASAIYLLKDRVRMRWGDKLEFTASGAERFHLRAARCAAARIEGQRHRSVRGKNKISTLNFCFFGNAAGRHDTEWEPRVCTQRNAIPIHFKQDPP